MTSHTESHHERRLAVPRRPAGSVTASEPREITGRRDADGTVVAVAGSLLVADRLVAFGSGWQPTGRRGLPARQAALVDRQGGEPRLVNTRSGWLAFTVSQTGWTDIHTVSPDGRDLHYIVSVTDDGTRIVDPTAHTEAP